MNTSVSATFYIRIWANFLRKENHIISTEETEIEIATGETIGEMTDEMIDVTTGEMIDETTGEMIEEMTEETIEGEEAPAETRTAATPTSSLSAGIEEATAAPGRDPERGTEAGTKTGRGRVLTLTRRRKRRRGKGPRVTMTRTESRVVTKNTRSTRTAA